MAEKTIVIGSYREECERTKYMYVHGKEKVKIIGTDYLRALVEYKNGAREWIVYGVLSREKGKAV